MYFKESLYIKGVAQPSPAFEASITQRTPPPSLQALSVNTKNSLSKFHEVIQSRIGHFDSSELTIFTALSITKGILLFYYVKNPFFLGAALINALDLKTVLWRVTNPLWQTSEKIKPLKLSVKSKSIYFDYSKKKEGLSIQIPLPKILKITKKNNFPALKRVTKNPILKPNASNQWESSAVFNSAALYLNNEVHFIYRAITDEGISVLGYAKSNDGIHIHYRSDKPVCTLNDTPLTKKKKYHTPYAKYESGNNWCGCEDPRISKIGDRIYMTYTSWDYKSPPFVAMTSITVTDFLKEKWHWEKPTRISPQNEIHKNWVIFPEKINRQYAVLHSISPIILIEYLPFLKKHKKAIPSYYHPDHRELCWDNWIRGAGPPPIKTNEGWLLLYHAMDTSDPNKYKIGAMLLDLKDPTKVLYRVSQPILEPDAYYENQGHKAGVVYTCGAVVIGNTLFVYYGGADTVLCCAKHNLTTFLLKIKNN